MSKVLLITGITGKSGGYFSQILCENKEEILSKFDGGIWVVVREASNTWMIDSSTLNYQKYVGSLDDVNCLKKP